MALRPPPSSEGNDPARPPIWRRVLAAPFIALSFLTYLVGHHAIGGLGRLLRWISHGCAHHVLYVFVQCRRWALGQPTWQVGDLMNQIQPITKRQIAYARAHPDLIEVRCECGGENCELGKRLAKSPHFMHRLQHALANAGVHSRIVYLVEAEIDRANRQHREDRRSNESEPS